MKITATALILASALVGTLAVTDQTFPPNGNQNVKDNVCKQTVKDLLTCANTEEYDSATGDWKAPNTCVDKYKATFEKCKGASIEYENKVAASGVDANQVARPSYAVAGTLSKVHAFQALVAIPAEDQKLRGVSCAICSKFTKKLLECALPATPTGGQTPLQAYRTAAFACLTSNWDQVLYDICLQEAEVSPFPLALDSSGKVSYVFASPKLSVNTIGESCYSVEGKAKANGAVFARIGKGHIDLP